MDGLSTEFLNKVHIYNKPSVKGKYRNMNIMKTEIKREDS